ncbi:hypothetical protein DPMN_181247 [Dreissena polymorpha]|uniref:Uncharacterized protein n=1 Tax=Dreissena polymorpha TaxID=45954 RepID=A0A9D4I3I8_DREPO|nr:hypothetical protein DPMN_181247 [Dreissena polymorpha]
MQETLRDYHSSIAIEVSNFKNLGAILIDGTRTAEVRKGIVIATTAMARLTRFGTCSFISCLTKLHAHMREVTRHVTNGQYTKSRTL